MRLLGRVFGLLLALLLMPTVAHAQAEVTGVVRDSSGAVLPGVTVEVASPALIEKIRSAVTDAAGQYRVVALPPGAYSVTFTLPGFSTLKREGVELTGTFIATINAELRVGELAETITVTGESPVVDVQSTRQQTTLDRQVLEAIPTGRSVNALAALIPASTRRSDVGGGAGAQTEGPGQAHGSVDSTIQTDGLSVGWLGNSANPTGASTGYYMTNFGGASEVVFTISGGLGEAEVGGPIANIVPRDGGNSFSGFLFATGATASMASNNYSDELRTRGLRAPNKIESNRDINAGFGGPVLRDHLWLFSTGRTIVAKNRVAGLYANRNAGNPAAWSYEPDLGRQAVQDVTQHQGSVRLTWQATRRNKIAIYWDEQAKCQDCIGGGGPFPGGAFVTMEASPSRHTSPNRVWQTSWSAPMTNRLLFEAGIGAVNHRWSFANRSDGTFDPRLIQVQEQSGVIPGLTYRAPGGCFPMCFSTNHDWTGSLSWRASMSYVTGSHTMKVGYLDGRNAPTIHAVTSNGGIFSYRLNNGVPNLIRLALNVDTAFVQRPFALYVQDQWTIRKLTLQGGLRYDYTSTSYTGGDYGGKYPVVRAGALLPNDIVFTGADTRGISYHDLSPRMGAAYDVFGNGRTAVKVFAGKYMVRQGGAFALVPLGSIGWFMNPALRLPQATSRSWVDNNRNFVPDCDLANPAAQGPTLAGAFNTVDTCGPYADQRFGREISTFFDPELTSGWGTRPYNWEFSASVQQQVFPRVSVNVGYFRRVFGNFFAIDNRAVTASDFSPYSVTVGDSRLPGGSVTVGNLYDVSPALFGRVDNFVTKAGHFGRQRQHWDGVDATVNARLSSLTAQGGLSTGRQLSDTCEIRAKLPEIAPTNPYCLVSEPLQTVVKGLLSYTIPRFDVQVSGTLQSIPGLQLAANFFAPNASVVSTLGRPLAGGLPNVVINLVKPGQQYGERTNQVDLRFAKILRFGRTRTQIGFDLYNAFNSNAIQNYNQTFVAGGPWLTPLAILQARIAKFSAQIDF